MRLGPGGETQRLEQILQLDPGSARPLPLNIWSEAFVEARTSVAASR